MFKIINHPILGNYFTSAAQLHQNVLAKYFYNLSDESIDWFDINLLTTCGYMCMSLKYFYYRNISTTILSATDYLPRNSTAFEL